MQHLLSTRELEILTLIGQGKKNPDIAQRLNLTEGTVKNYVTRILQILSQFGVRDRVQAALWAQKHGL